MADKPKLELLTGDQLADAEVQNGRFAIDYDAVETWVSDLQEAELMLVQFLVERRLRKLRSKK